MGLHPVLDALLMLRRALLLPGLEELFPGLLGQLDVVSAGEEDTVFLGLRSLLNVRPLDRLPGEIDLSCRRIGQNPTPGIEIRAA